ncbi:restriction endonuclease subunit S [Enterobacter ludwigii]|uniref:restriction endonuclease subunit S n=1 Tax=Enterobacteriaceae TaxID=543 RepID=UPI002FD52066|nr:restriction endonuclease subunit S [Enterobacter cloacae]
MSSNWPVVRIDDIKADRKNAITIGPFGSRMKSDCYVESGIAVIRGTNLGSTSHFINDFVYITEKKADELASCNVYKNDLVFPHRGSIGEVGIVEHEQRYVLSSSLMKLTCAADKACPKFIYYFFKSSTGRHELLKNASQVGTPGIGQPLSSLKSIELSLPPLKIQENIVKILSGLDEKIHINQQINQTLEQMAQALFKSWFVDFEPVKAKIAALEEGSSQEDATLAAMSAISGKDADTLAVFEREQPEHYAELKATAELFPSAMQESELGEVPEGWRTENVENIINRLKVKNTFPADCIKQFGQHPVLEQGAKIYQGYHDEEPSFNASLQSPMFIFGDHTCVMHLSTVPFDISKNTLVLKGKGFNTYWTFFALKGKQKFQEYKRHWSDLKVKQVVIPDENNGLLLTKYFAVKCEDLFGLLEQNRKQNLILQNIRDTLLPKLLSGEITLPEAELVISEAENV